MDSHIIEISPFHCTLVHLHETEAFQKYPRLFPYKLQLDLTVDIARLLSFKCIKLSDNFFSTSREHCYTFLGHPAHGGVFSSSSIVHIEMMTHSPQVRVLILPFWTLTAEDDLDEQYRGVIGLFNEEVLLKASDQHAVRVWAPSEHLRSRFSAKHPSLSHLFFKGPSVYDRFCRPPKVASGTTWKPSVRGRMKEWIRSLRG